MNKIRKRPRTLRPVWPNCGIEVKYRKKLQEMIDDMHQSVTYWLTAAYKNNDPLVGQLADMTGDAQLPITVLRAALRRMVRQWFKRWDVMTVRLARWFGQSVATRSDATLRRILKQGGWTVEFKLTDAQRDALGGIISSNVALIKSIPQQYFNQVEQLVFSSVTAGRDLKEITDELQRRYMITRKRAKLISKDQNNKATGALTRVRRLELGLTEALWLHSHAGKKPRPTHVKMHNREFNIAQGMWDPAERKYIQPGELINCRCTSRPVIPGFS